MEEDGKKGGEDGCWIYNTLYNLSEWKGQLKAEVHQRTCDVKNRIAREVGNMETKAHDGGYTVRTEGRLRQRLSLWQKAMLTYRISLN